MDARVVEQARDPSFAMEAAYYLAVTVTRSRRPLPLLDTRCVCILVPSATSPLAQAKRLCPNGIFMRGNHALYRGDASRKVRAILESITPLVEAASIDEAYLDISGSLNLFGGDDAIAMHIEKSASATSYRSPARLRSRRTN